MAECGTAKNPHEWHLTAYDRTEHIATRGCGKCRKREYIKYYIKPSKGRRNGSVIARTVN